MNKSKLGLPIGTTLDRFIKQKEDEFSSATGEPPYQVLKACQRTVNEALRACAKGTSRKEQQQEHGQK